MSIVGFIIIYLSGIFRTAHTTCFSLYSINFLTENCITRLASTTEDDSEFVSHIQGPFVEEIEIGELGFSGTAGSPSSSSIRSFIHACHPQQSVTPSFIHTLFVKSAQGACLPRVSHNCVLKSIDGGPLLGLVGFFFIILEQNPSGEKRDKVAGVKDFKHFRCQIFRVAVMFISVLITWLTLFFLAKLLCLQPLPPLTSRDVRLVSCWWFWREGPPFGSSAVCEETHKTEDDAGEIMSILDLPDLVLECILQKQPPDALCRMASVCSDLRDMCLSDHLWERHMRAKWGRVIGSTARQGWHMAVRNDPASLEPRKGLLGIILRKLWPFPWVRSRSDCKITSLVAWYSALESGKQWFPAQVYNRENSHVGFMLSSYDAELNYDHSTDTFKARYLPHGRRPVAVEDGVAWERVRAPPVRTSPRDLHVSDCLSDLCPGDHVEIQWRRNKEFPYGWWYGVVGHLESCDGNERFCRCNKSDTVVLEFNQYAPSSRWRRSLIDRKDHREEGNEGRGFYGGIRKISSQDEISVWKRFWPTQPLE